MEEGTGKKFGSRKQVVGKYQLLNISAGGYIILDFLKAFHTSLVLALLGLLADFWLVFGKYIYLVLTPI
jgi:hypothetical protein